MKHLLNNVSIDSVKTGTLATGSPVITSIASTVGLSVGEYLNGTGIPIGASIVSIDSATQITISANATATGAESLTFYNPIICDGAVPLLTIYGASYGGGTVTVQASPDNGATWITLTRIIDNMPAVFTANAMVTCYEVSQGYLIRATLTGSTSPSKVFADWGM